jgi:predicted HAD superfamily Cof-like phosphohydrolase
MNIENEDTHEDCRELVKKLRAQVATLIEERDTAASELTLSTDRAIEMHAELLTTRAELDAANGILQSAKWRDEAGPDVFDIFERSLVLQWNKTLDKLCVECETAGHTVPDQVIDTLNKLVTAAHEKTFENSRIVFQRLTKEQEDTIDAMRVQISKCDDIMTRAGNRIDELLTSNTETVKRLRNVDRYQMVREFFVVAHQDRPEGPSIPDEKRLRLAMRLIAEEFVEVFTSVVHDNKAEAWHIEALKRELDYLVEHGRVQVRDLPETIDGIVDAGYVLEGLGIALGVDLRPMWAEVQRANMAKMGGPKDPDTGKQLKPEGWTPPDIAGELVKQGWSPL